MSTTLEMAAPNTPDPRHIFPAAIESQLAVFDQLSLRDQIAFATSRKYDDIHLLRSRIIFNALRTSESLGEEGIHIIALRTDPKTANELDTYEILVVSEEEDQVGFHFVNASRENVAAHVFESNNSMGARESLEYVDSMLVARNAILLKPTPAQQLLQYAQNVRHINSIIGTSITGDRDTSHDPQETVRDKFYANLARTTSLDLTHQKNLRLFSYLELGKAFERSHQSFGSTFTLQPQGYNMWRINMHAPDHSNQRFVRAVLRGDHTGTEDAYRDKSYTISASFKTGLEEAMRRKGPEQHKIYCGIVRHIFPSRRQRA